MGSPVNRFYGTEVLRIDPQSVIIDRMSGAGIPLLDSHNQSGISSALGRVTRVWFSGDALMGTLSFNATKEGRIAEGMVARGELSGISAGYRVEEWSIADADGNVIDGDRAQWDDDLTFTATRWELLECSLCSVPADSTASVRSLGGKHHIGTDDIAERMLIRTRMHARQRMLDAQSSVIGKGNE
jgi:phage head maturation protease